MLIPDEVAELNLAQETGGELEKLLGKHPLNWIEGFVVENGRTNSGVPHRSLTHDTAKHSHIVTQLQSILIKHHLSEEMIDIDKRKIEHLRKLDYPITPDIIHYHTHRFPKSDKTRKGNLAEIFLADYIGAASSIDLPVYRLHYNPNVEQSMKGDDVLAFDFSLERPRIIVGEAKFRKKPSKTAIQDIIEGLFHSYDGGLPVSLSFVADRLYEAKKTELADKINDCSLKMAEGRLDFSYVGLLLSSTSSKWHVDQHTERNVRSLVMISLGIEEPSQFVSDCYEGIEIKAYDSSQ